MIWHTPEELSALYEEIYALYEDLKNSSTRVAGLETVIEYVMESLLDPIDENKLDTSDNIYTRLEYRSEHSVVYADDMKVTNIFERDKKSMIRIALLIKKLIFGTPLEDVPLYVTEELLPVRIIAAWRLRIGK